MAKKYAGNIASRARRLIDYYLMQSGQCYICGGKMDLNVNNRLNHRNPKSASFDHVMPKALIKYAGLQPNKSNLLLAHHKCNNKKCNSIPELKHIMLSFSLAKLRNKICKLREKDDFENLGVFGYNLEDYFNAK